VQLGDEGRRGQPLQAAMRPPVVVVHPPLVENDPSLRQAQEQLAVKQLVAEPAVEALHAPMFRDLFLPQGPPDGFHRPAATLGARQVTSGTDNSSLSSAQSRHGFRARGHGFAKAAARQLFGELFGNRPENAASAATSLIRSRLEERQSVGGPRASPPAPWVGIRLHPAA
jgi:hypothetical protein